MFRRRKWERRWNFCVWPLLCYYSIDIRKFLFPFLYLEVAKQTQFCSRWWLSPCMAFYPRYKIIWIIVSETISACQWILGMIHLEPLNRDKLRQSIAGKILSNLFSERNSIRNWLVVYFYNDKNWRSLKFHRFDFLYLAYLELWMKSL